ncbi:MAG: hypothetical protein ABIG55_06425, partial [Candidatus Omnitrophota bacterium]
DKKEELKHAEMFSDIIKLINTESERKGLTFMLGTSWIKGYVEDRYLQYDALNPLISDVRRFCADKGIPFITKEDKDLISAINEARVRDKDAKIVVLAGKDIIEDKEFKDIVNDDKIFFAGVDNSRLTTDSYMRLMEMMTLTLKLAFNKPVDLDNPNILIEKSKKFTNVYVFVPDAEPMDYERLKEIYRAQIFA